MGTCPSELDHGAMEDDDWSDASCFLLHNVDSWVHMNDYPGKTWHHKNAENQQRQSDAMFCWGILGHRIHMNVTLTCTTCLDIAEDQIHPFLSTVFLNGCHLFQLATLEKLVQEHDKKVKVFTCPANSPDLSMSDHL